MFANRAPMRQLEAGERANLYQEGIAGLLTEQGSGGYSDDKRRLYEGLLPDDDPITTSRYDRWQFFTEGVKEDFSEEGSFDMGQKNEDVEYSLLQEWRRPEWRRRNLEILLENQLKRVEEVKRNPHLLNYGTSGNLSEATTSATDVAAFTTAALPMVRRMWPRVYYQDLVPSLAWTQPTGRLFFLDFTFASTGESYSVGARIDNVEDPDYTDDPGECTAVNEIDASITAQTMTAIAHKVLSTWSLEAQQDVGSYFGLSLESELLRHQALLMARNKQRKVIEDLRTLGTGGTASFDKTVPGAGVFSTIDPNIYKRTLIENILDVDNSIFKLTFLKTSWLVMDPDTANYLEEVESFSLDPIGDMRGRTRISTTPNLRGTLRSRWDVYVDPFLVPDQIIVGARGPSFLETGYVVLEYVPLFALPLWVDPRDMCVHRSAMERFARQMIKSEYYGKVNLFST